MCKNRRITMEQLITFRNFLMTFGVVVVLFVTYTTVVEVVPDLWKRNTPSDQQFLSRSADYLDLTAPENFRLSSVNYVQNVEGYSTNKSGSSYNKYRVNIETTYETSVDFYETSDYRSRLKKATNNPSTIFHMKYPEGTKINFLRTVSCDLSRDCSGTYKPKLTALEDLHMLDDLGPKSAVTWIRERYPNATFLDEDGEAVVFAPAPAVESTTPTAPSEPGISRSKRAKI